MKENEIISINNNLVNNEIIDIKDEKFQKIIFIYNSALKEIKTKIEILQEELRLFSNYEPIEYVSTRLKKPDSIIQKLQRKNLDLTYANMFQYVNDIAGIRIVCNFKSDVYKIASIIENFQEVRILDKKDFMKWPKKSGYMSYHLILEIPINLSSGQMNVKVEVQVRTLGMDFWASLEHKLKYKNPNIGKNESKNLMKYARVINNIDDNMLMISNKLEKKQMKNIVIEAAEEKNKKIDFKL